MHLRRSIRDQTVLSLSMAKHIASEEGNKDSNLVFSPLSINLILSLIAAGCARPALHQCLSILNSESLDHLAAISSHAISRIFSDASLSFACGLWADHSVSLKPSFKQLVGAAYRADAHQVDFVHKSGEAIDEVNSWIESQTKGLISQIVSPGSVNSMTRLIIANALYFKGEWDQTFSPSETKNYDFHIPGKDPISAPFMTSQEDQFIGCFDGFKVLKLPYKHGDDKRCFSMCIYLPDAEDGLPPLIEKLDSESDFLYRHTPSEAVEVGEFRIPKFKFCFGFKASGMFERLGLTLPFTGGSLTEMVTDSSVGEELFVSNIFHKAAIEVNEEGTEAGAATEDDVMGCSLYPPEPVDFVADRPFLFLIIESITGAILFFGRVANPLLTG